MPAPLLVLSNGHGEDLIALRVIEALRQRQPDLLPAVLPLVGEGGSFESSAARGLVRLLGPRCPLPSGGFSNQSLAGLGQDLLAGLAQLSWQQWRVLQAWCRSNPGGSVLAIGDVLPLLLAWASGAPYGFIGTPKSDFTWTSPPPRGWRPTPAADAYHRCKGSEWDPWEWMLMRQRRCRLVAVRDRLTARGLRRRGVPAQAPGNPMLDHLGSAPPPPAWLRRRRRLLLLPGSRVPECLRNASRLLEVLVPWQPTAAATLLIASTSRPERQEWNQHLCRHGLEPIALGSDAAALGAHAAWRRGCLEVLLGYGRFAQWAGWAEVGLANAGTATEQLAGLGVPVLSLPGPGPQFTINFARRQSRLLGGAVQPCAGPADLARRLEQLLDDGALRRHLGQRGQRHMGEAGGGDRLAALVEERLLLGMMQGF
ncbi:lipid-A-disaccharide synthase-related protein [Cyanobium sp. NIES-981]|uniref:lipid-A-disaccharide synthase-related protein n=1 Tax=Cyanobium sp. NIES-981 TaxID=1851505 RepID=UPI0007DD405C|nr:lipid-A-disaccharide synthase-related protein [Cyanobium sp. NIES-981]SBO43519.1 conserved protein of unknown function [Cyanobium sp. NIES-981]